MRFLFFTLMLANAVVLGYMMLRSSTDQAKPQAHAALHPESMRIKSEAPAGASEASSARVCLEWSGLSDADFNRAREAVEKKGLSVVLPTGVDFWVHMPPLKSQAEAEKKMRELKGFGVEDGSIIEDKGKWQYAVSLAAFGSQQEAEFYLKQLRDKGVKSAKFVERRSAANSLTLVDLDLAQKTAVEKLQSDFPGSELNPAQCSVR